MNPIFSQKPYTSLFYYVQVRGTVLFLKLRKVSSLYLKHTTWYELIFMRPMSHFINGIHVRKS